MIGFADIAIEAFYKTGIFGNLSWMKTVKLDYPEVSLQNLAASTGQDNIGTPGMTIGRTSCNPDPQRQSMPHASTGQVMGRLNDGSFGALKSIMMNPIYTFVAWAQAESDLNAIEREIWFSAIYKVLNFTAKDEEGNPTVICKFDLFHNADLTYQRITDKNTGETLFYSFTKTMTVVAPWAKSVNYPQIKQIQVTYKEAGAEEALEIIIDPASV